jgi:hypothetical protein
MTNDEVDDEIEEIGRRKGRKDGKKLAFDRGRWKEFVEAPLTL